MKEEVVTTRLTKNEKKVMEILWKHSVPMTSAEIAEHADGWKPSYIHLMISDLLRKNLIQVSGFKQTTKNFARLFTPTMSREACKVREILGENPDNEVIVRIIQELYQMADDETRARIEEVVNGII